MSGRRLANLKFRHSERIYLDSLADIRNFDFFSSTFSHKRAAFEVDLHRGAPVCGSALAFRVSPSPPRFAQDLLAKRSAQLEQRRKQPRAEPWRVDPALRVHEFYAQEV
jgi:hypothetical protein